VKKYKNAILIAAGTLLLVAIFIVSLVAIKNRLNTDKRESTSVNGEEKEIKETTKTKLVKKGMSTVFSSAAGKDIDVSEYIDKNFAAEDAKFVNEILDDKLDADMVIKIVESYISDGDVSSKSLDSLLEKMTPEERDKLEEIYDTYGDDFIDYIEGRVE